MASKRRLEDVADQLDDQDSTHPARKRRLQYSEADAQLAKLYADLSDEVKSTRIKAAAELVRSLKHTDVAKIDQAISRLLKGLCSNRKAARSGFFVALIEILSLSQNASVESADFSPSSLVNKIESITQPESTASKQESRDYLLGRCLAFKAVIQSKTLFHPGRTLEDWEALLDRLIGLAHANPWLRKDCGTVLFESVAVLSQVQNVDVEYISTLLQRLQSAGLIKTAEGLAIWIVAQHLFPSASFPKNVWHHNDPLCSKERASVAKILRDNEPEAAESLDAGRSTSGRPQSTPSFAWTPIFQELSRRQQTSGQVSDFTKFWQEALDNAYFSSNASTERKSLGLQILTLGIQRLPAPFLSSVLAPNVIRCIINQRADSSHYLFQLARLPLDALVDRVKTDPDAAHHAFEALMTGNGAVNIDQLTKTKTVDEILSRSRESSFSSILRAIDGIIIRPKASDHLTPEASRRFSADLLLAFVRKTSTPAGGAFPWTELLDQLVSYGYISGSPNSKAQCPSPAISKESQDMFRNRTTSCLSHALNAKLDPDFVLAHYIITHVNEMTQSAEYELALHADGKIMKALQIALAAASQLHQQEKKSKSLAMLPSIKAFRLLYDLSILQVYNGDSDAVAVLEDLHTCFQSWQTSSDDASLMLVEIVLSFISKPSTLFRKLAEQVFTAFASQLGEEGLQSMLDILEKRENLSGQQELFDQAEDGVDHDEDSEEDSDEEDDSDVEIIDESEADEEEHDDDVASNDDAVSGSSKEDSSSQEDDEDSGDEEQNAFEAKLAQALGTSGADMNNGQDPDSDSDDSDMDDAQMMALDGHLTTIFRERTKQTSKRKDGKDAKENIVNFKNRVLDLLLIFAKQQHDSPLVLDMILPLLSLIRTTSAKQISEKASNVLKQLQDACNKDKKFPIAEDHDRLVSMIATIHKEVRQNASKLHSNACSRISLFLAKILVNIDLKYYDQIADLYSRLQKEWYSDPKSSIQPSIFTEWTSWSIATKKR